MESEGVGFTELLNALSERGWAAMPNFIDIKTVRMLRQEIEDLNGAGRLRPAGIGRDERFQITGRVRSDSILWLEPDTLSPAQKLALDRLEELRITVNRNLFLGLKELEAHVTRYEPGAFYERHIDRFQHDKGRMGRELSVVLYLNDGWTAEQGGELAIYDRERSSDLASLVAPIGGTLACFLSREIWHEVRPMSEARYSLTGWFLA